MSILVITGLGGAKEERGKREEGERKRKREKKEKNQASKQKGCWHWQE